MKRDLTKIVVYILIIFLLLLGLVFILEKQCVAKDAKTNDLINVDRIRMRLGLAEGVLEKYYLALSENNLDRAWSYMDESFSRVTSKEEWVKSREMYKGEKLQEYAISENSCMFVEGTQIGVQMLCHAQYKTFITVEYMVVDITDGNVGIGSITLYGIKEIGKDKEKKNGDQLVERNDKFHI